MELRFRLYNTLWVVAAFVGVWFLTSCNGIPAGPSKSSTSAAAAIVTPNPDWVQQIALAKSAASKIDGSAVFYLALITSSYHEVDSAGQPHELEEEFDFIQASGGTVRIVFEDSSPSDTLKSLQESPHYFPYKQHYAGSIEDVRLGPRDAEAVAWHNLPETLQKAGVYPIIYLNLDRLPLTWEVEFVSTNHALNTREAPADSPTRQFSPEYAYAFKVDAKTGDIINQDPAIK